MYAKLCEHYHHWYLQERSQSPATLLTDFLHPRTTTHGTALEAVSSLDQAIVRVDRTQ